MDDKEIEEWCGAVSQRIDQIEDKLDKLRTGLAKMILGMSGQPVVIDIEKDLGVRLPRESPLIVPATQRQ